MAAFDTPWLSRLEAPSMSSRDDASQGASPPSYETHPSNGGGPPTYATFSPVTLSSNAPSRSSRRSTILVHQKSPLLLATPPQITRALAYSHPFLLPLNTFAGLITWSSGDPWQSFLLLCAFWATVLYGDVIVTWAGPIVVGMGLIAGMYGRRYSPLSSSGWTEPRSQIRDSTGKTAGQTGGEGGQQKGKANAGEKQSKHTRGNSEVTNTKHQKTLDEIVETLKELTGRCNVLMEPLLDLTDFLSTQRTPTSATTRPALTVVFMRLLIITPVWIALSVPPWHIITTRRVLLVAGTIMLTWHARVLRVSRTILWRSSAVRRMAAAITGLHFETVEHTFQRKAPATDLNNQQVRAQQQESELTKALGRTSFQTNRRSGDKQRSAGVKFTFIIYENQRRWVGLGWTNNLFAYERSSWTDEHGNAVPAKEDFELPGVEDGSRMVWRWVEGGRWRVDGVADEQGPVDYDGDEGKNGWIFYDNKWQNGQRGSDGWTRWTRRRKWYRDAELVEVDHSQEDQGKTTARESTAKATATPRAQAYSSNNESMSLPKRIDSSIAEENGNDDASSRAEDSLSVHSTSSRSFFRSPLVRRRAADRSSDKERTRRPSSSYHDDDSVGLGAELALEIQKQGKDGGQWGIGDEARMSLG